ncbi:MAG: hypothetical protein HYW78_02955 [Parcubacteria group bacterium]|nr:hypothetical protein [Parcubacteria group bacterium]
MPDSCANLKHEYESLQRLADEYIVVYLRVRDSGDLTEAKQLKKELTQKRDEVWKLLCGEQYEKLEKEFNRQVDILVNKGFPALTKRKEQEFRAIFTPLRKHLFKLSREKFPEGHIPFIIVPSEKLLSLQKKVSLMEVEGEKGYTVLDLSELKTAEGVEIPESLVYLTVDVENGKAMLGKSPNKSVEHFREEYRFSLTVEEGVAFILYYPEILKDHNIDLPGSRFGDGKAADLWLIVGGRLGLDWHWANYSDAKWGSASCGRRV